MPRRVISERCLSADPQLTAQLLQALADTPEGVSLARLCKQLGVRMSVLLRTLA
jgi:DNA-binding IclR family transcriptional regulator